MDTKAFQIEVTATDPIGRRIFFVEAESGEAAMLALAKHAAVQPKAVLKLMRRLSDSEIDLHQIGPAAIIQWI